MRRRNCNKIYAPERERQSYGLQSWAKKVMQKSQKRQTDAE